MSLIVQRVPGVDRSPAPPRIKVEAAAHGSQDVQRPRSKLVPRVFPELSNSLRLDLADRIALLRLLAYAHQHGPRDAVGGSIACVKLEAFAARSVRPMAKFDRWPIAPSEPDWQ